MRSLRKIDADAVPAPILPAPVHSAQLLRPQPLVEFGLPVHARESLLGSPRYRDQRLNRMDFDNRRLKSEQR